MSGAGAGERPRGLAQHLPVLWPAAMLLGFFVVPFGFMLTFSFYRRIQAGFYEPAFVLDNYARFLSPLFVDTLLFSIGLCALAAAVCVALALPFTLAVARLRRRTQVAWMVFILAVLSLSEVIIGFSWSVLLGRAAGISNLFVTLGLLERPEAYAPGFLALLLGLSFLAFPYAVLLLFPAVVRLDPEVIEASRTLGAAPLTAFRTVILPALRSPLMIGLILVFVFTLGSYLLPQMLGRPQHWTLSILITDQAIFQSNIPFAAALAIFLMLVSLALVALTLALGRRRQPA